jgi:hypothetical protein
MDLKPLYTRILNTVVRNLLTAGAGALIARGVITSADANQLVAALTEGLVGLLILGGSLVYSSWRARQTQTKLNTALAASTPMSEAQLDTQIAQGVKAPAAVPKTVVPAAVDTKAA